MHGASRQHARRRGTTRRIDPALTAGAALQDSRKPAQSMTERSLFSGGPAADYHIATGQFEVGVGEPAP